MRACYMEHEETTEFLCERDPTALRIKNSTGQTCMDLASQSLNPLIANLLKKKSLETSSDELQIGGRKRASENDKLFQNLVIPSCFSFGNTQIMINRKEASSLENNETNGKPTCKYFGHLDTSAQRYF